MTTPTNSIDEELYAVDESIFEPTDTLEDILLNLAWKGRYTDAGQDFISRGEVAEAKARLCRLIGKERLEELDAIRKKVAVDEQVLSADGIHRRPGAEGRNKLKRQLRESIDSRKAQIIKDYELEGDV